MNKEKLLYTFHDELFYDLIMPHKENKKRKTSVELLGNNQSFTTHELFLIFILLDHYKKFGSIDCHLTFSHIHKNYRNKRTGRTIVMNQKELQIYKNAINSLQQKRIKLEIKNTRKRYGVNNTYISDFRLLIITAYTEQENGDISFDYTLSQYGQVLLNSKRFSDILPIEILHISYQQAMILYIGIYLSRLIFINQRKKQSEFTINISSIMKHIRMHDKQGNDTGKTLYEILKDNISNKYTYLNTFKKDLENVLYLIYKNGKIYNRRFISIELENLNVKNYELSKLQIYLK